MNSYSNIKRQRRCSYCVKTCSVILSDSFQPLQCLIAKVTCWHFILSLPQSKRAQALVFLVAIVGKHPTILSNQYWTDNQLEIYLRAIASLSLHRLTSSSRQQLHRSKHQKQTNFLFHKLRVHLHNLLNGLVAMLSLTNLLHVFWKLENAVLNTEVQTRKMRQVMGSRHTSIEKRSLKNTLHTIHEKRRFDDSYIPTVWRFCHCKDCKTMKL